ncbi:MAG: carboxypeptidase-like regulatory domain-containing protein [Cryomorphaceae bacterium]|nr:carboxypeptidase-like regulatory domain-containing protein [Cryomorphaceae bacterium]
MHKGLLLTFTLLLSVLGYGQTISGLITDEENNILSAVNISVLGKSIGVISEDDGLYSLTIPANQSVVIGYSFIGYHIEKIRIPMLKKGQTYNLNIQLQSSSTLLDDVIVTDQKSRKKSFSRIKPKHVSVLPGNSGGIEAILKTLPGVSSANELSSQYSVRGGNFDENLVYVNGIEVYRPFLVRSGQQEGLSFVNTDMVGSIQFSAGGFEAKYGDKMSSVLDITYKRPRETAASLQLSMLGGSGHIEGTNKNGRLSYLIGARHKTSKYLFNAMDTKADYIPKFSDLQAFINYELNTDWQISFLGNISKNEYTMIPENRDTDFGTINEALKLRIYFEGQEVDKYETFFGALSTTYQPSTELNLQFTTSAFQTFEQENFDILGEYWLYQLENNLGSDEFGDVAFDRGVGKYINHARNSLNARVLNFSHKGNYNKEAIKVDWGFRMQKEEIEDKISEWNLIDSAFFNFPHPADSIGNPTSNPNQQIVMSELLKTQINLSSFRNSGYMQVSKDIGNLTINAGTRGSYWTYNEELLMSPRASLAYAPIWEKDVVFRAASGIYYQSPFYKELRTPEGTLNSNIKAQKSTHYVLAADYLFYKWGRPFKWITEVYYKDLENLIPYKVDNVRIQYLANDLSNGYATGIDIKVNGEFVPGVESWASLSVMKTAEDIVGDTKIDANGNTVEAGYIPRPTDQRVNFSMFFQDYIPGKPKYKMHLNLIYGTGLPFGPPNGEKYQDILRIPNYRRVDIGFSAVLKSADKKSKLKWLNTFNSIWVSAEVFNLLDINNTVSYLWVADVSGREYAVPNYLTARQLNAKLIFTF